MADKYSPHLDQLVGKLPEVYHTGKTKEGHYKFLQPSNPYKSEPDSESLANKIHSKIKKHYPNSQIVQHYSHEPFEERGTLEGGSHHRVDIHIPKSDKEHMQKTWGSGKGNPNGDVK